MKKLFTMIIACFMMLMTLTGCGGGAKESGEKDAEKSTEEYTAVWKLAHNESERGTMQIYADLFKKSVEEKSNGKITVEIYPSGTLGEGDAIVELLRGGGVEFALADSGYVGTFVPECQIFRAHFLLSDDMEINRKLLNEGEAIQLLNQKFMDNGLQVLQHFSTGFVDWTANKPITKVEDLQGLKMRVVPVSILVDMYKAYGANPTAVNYSELYSSLQLGVVEAQENPLYSVDELGLNEVQTSLTLSKHYPFIATCIANPDFYNQLPPEAQTIITETVTELENSIDQTMDDYNSSILKKLKENTTMEIVELSNEARQGFKEFAKAHRDVLKNALGDSGMEILQKMEAEREELENK